MSDGTQQIEDNSDVPVNHNITEKSQDEQRLFIQKKIETTDSTSTKRATGRFRYPSYQDLPDPVPATTSFVIPPRPSDEEIISCFPESLKEITEALLSEYQIDPMMSAMVGLGQIAADVGSKIDVKEWKDIFHPPSLSFIGIAPSGEGKTMIFDLMLGKYKKRVYEELIPNYKYMCKSNFVKNELIDEEVKKIKDKIRNKSNLLEIDKIEKNIMNLENNRPSLLFSPDNWADDITGEALIEALQDHNLSMFWSSSDGRNMLGDIQGKGYQTRSDLMSVYLKLIWGDTYTYTRKNPGKNKDKKIILDRPSLSTLIFVQPDNFKKFILNAESRDSGMIPRFLIWFPKSTAGKLQRSENTTQNLNKNKIFRFHDNLWKLKTWEVNKKVKMVLSQKAQIAANKFFNYLDQQTVEHGYYNGYLDITRKSTAIATRIAANFEILKRASLDDLPKYDCEEEIEINFDSWQKAASLQQYFFFQMLDVLNLKGTSNSDLMEKTKLRILKVEAPQRQIQNSWHEENITPSNVLPFVKGRMDSELNSSGLEEKVFLQLVAEGWLISPTIYPGKKRPYFLNAKLKKFLKSPATS